MASPVDAARATDTWNGESPVVINLPTGITAGDLLIVALRQTQAQTATTPAGWTTLLNNDATDATDDTQHVFYKVADGSEGSTVSVAVSATGKGCSIAWRITGAADPVLTQVPQIAVATFTTAANAANPPSITPTGGSKDYLFLAVMGAGGASTVASAAPTNYSNLTGNNAPGGSAATQGWISGASRQLTASSEDPGAFTHIASSGGLAMTIAVHPRVLAKPAGTSPQPTFWAKADQLSQSDNTAVSQWPDSSGNGRHLNQATAGARPTFQTAEINSLPCVRFDGSDDQMASGALLSAILTASAKTVIAVVKPSADTAGGHEIVGATGGFWGIRRAATGGWEHFNWDGTDDHADVTQATGGWGLIVGTHGSGNLRLYASAGTASGDSTVASGSTTDVTGALRVGPFQAMDLAELLIYDTTLNSTDLAAVESYLKSKYGFGAPVDMAAKTLKWDMPAQINQSARTLKWDMVAQVNQASRTLLWDLRSEVNQTARTLKWDLYGAVNQTVRTLLWDLIAQVNQSARTLKWDLVAQVDQAARTLKWDLAGIVDAAAKTLLWDMAGGGNVVNSNPVVLKWDLIAEVNQAAKVLKWDLAAIVDANARTIKWDIYNAVNQNARTLLWDLRAQADMAAKTLKWDMQGAVNGNTKTLKWDIGGFVSAISTLKWDVGGAPPLVITPPAKDRWVTIP